MVDKHNPREVLNSWKEIATYLDRGVRTVQRWERNLHLPVHRLGSGKRSPVFALARELDFWMSTSEALRAAETPVIEPVTKPDSPVQYARHLRASVRILVRTVAESSVRQRRQTEMLQKRIEEMRRQIHGRSSGALKSA